MKHYQRIQNAIDFIEQHLSESFSLQDVSQTAFSSLSYMHRIFYQMTGFTMKAYVRQRRLAMAVSELHQSRRSLLDIALSSGFDSAESFTRAFKKQHGITPSHCRQHQQEMPVFQPLDVENKQAFVLPADLDFQLSLEAVSFQSVQLMGYLTQTTLENDQQAVDICRFADEVIQSGKMARHFDLAKTAVFGVYTNMSDSSHFDYTIAGLQDAAILPDSSMVRHSLAAGHYAKFTLNRNDRIKEAWHYIYGVWFPQIAALRTPGYDFEIYQPSSTAIYIPMSDVPMQPMVAEK